MHYVHSKSSILTFSRRSCLALPAHLVPCISHFFVRIWLHLEPLQQKVLHT